MVMPTANIYWLPIVYQTWWMLWEPYGCQSAPGFYTNPMRQVLLLLLHREKTEAQRKQLAWVTLCNWQSWDSNLGLWIQSPCSSTAYQKKNSNTHLVSNPRKSWYPFKRQWSWLNFNSHHDYMRRCVLQGKGGHFLKYREEEENTLSAL